MALNTASFESILATIVAVLFAVAGVVISQDAAR